MTPRSYSRDRALKVKQVVDARGDKTASSAKLRSHPDYPAYLNVVGPDEEYQQELLERAWNQKTTLWTASTSNERLLRPHGQTDKISRNTAVYQSDGIVQQLVAKRTRQETSVLGRVGVIDIYKEQLESPFKGMGLKLTTSDLARLIIGADRPTPQEIAGICKLLTRLNAGEYVNEGGVRMAADKLNLWVEDLVFDSAIYETILRNRGSARKRRGEHVRRVRNRQLVQLREKLRRYQVPLVPLQLSEVNLLQRIHSTNGLRDRVRYEPLYQQNENYEARQMAVADFVAAVETEPRAKDRSHAINRAWAKLEDCGLQLWVGEYEDLTQIWNHGTDPSDIPGKEAKSHAVKVLIIVIGDAGVSRSSFQVDLSHTVDLMPSVEQLIAAIMDDPSP